MKFSSTETISTIQELLSQATVVWSCLVFAGYFLITTRHGSAIPAYFLALTGLLGCLLAPVVTYHRLKKSLSFSIFVAFLIYILINIVWFDSGVRKDLVSITIDIVVLFFVATAFSHIQPKIDVIRSIMISVMSGAAISAIILLLIQAFGLGLDPAGAWNVHSVASIAFGFVVLLAFNYSIRYRMSFQGIIYASVAVISLAVVLLLESPVVFFGLLVALTALSFGGLWESRFNGKSLLWILICSALMVSVLQMFNVLVEQKRSDIWASTLAASFNEGMVFGIGYSATSVLSLGCEDGGLSEEITFCNSEHPHNLFVSVIYQLGLVGFLLLFSLYLVALGGLFERRSKQRWLLGGCLFYSAAIFMFDGNLVVANMDFVWLIFWLPIFLIMREEFSFDSDH